MQNNERQKVRQILQDEAVELLLQNQRLLCQWATGTGKSWIVMNFLSTQPDYKTLILVPEQDNIKNWQVEFEKFGLPYDNVTIACYASLHKYQNTSWDFLVLDEVPHIDTMKRLGSCSTITASYVLALGAVVSEEELYALQSMYGDFLISKVNLTDAIAKGILPEPQVRVLHLQMNKLAKTIKYSGRLVSEWDRYVAYQNEIDAAKAAYDVKPTYFNQQRLFRAGNARKRYLGHLKEEKLKTVCQKLENAHKRFLCFCSSVAQAESIGKDKSYTSKTPASLKLLDKFNNHEIDSLYVVGKLIEGQTLKDIEIGIIGQLGGTDRITVQSIGRILRSEKPIIYVLVFDGTKDDSFLKTITDNIPAEYIKHYNF